MKKFNKILSFILITMLVLTMIPLNLTKNIFAANHISVLDEPSITKVPLGTETDSKYSFSIKATPKTTCEIWGYPQDKVLHERTNSNTWFQDHTVIMPTNDSLSGKIGCWFRNVGVYQGKSIDVKCTYYWKPLTVEGKKINPVIDATFSPSSLGFHFFTSAYEVKFDLYSNGKPIKVNMSLTFLDIDWCQAYGFSANTGSIHNIQCVPNAYSYYTEELGRKWIYSSPKGTDVIPESSVRMEIDNTDSFNIVYGADSDRWSYPINKIFPSDEASMVTEIKRRQNLANQAMTSMDFTLFINDRGGLGWGGFDATAYGPYSITTPIKTITDTDETRVNANAVSDKEIFSYNIHESIPQEDKSFFYRGFKLEDTLPDAVTYQSAYVYDNGNQDVSSLFNITQNGQKITFTLKNPSAESFYNNEYKFVINVKLNKDNLSQFKVSNNSYKFNNTATVSIERNGTNTKTSNTVTTNYYTKDVQINKIWKDNNYTDRPSSINYVLKQDGIKFKEGTITANNNWQTTISELPMYRADGAEYTYTVEESQITLPNGDIYIPSYNGLTITNTLHGKTNLTVTKIWADWNNEYMVRPDSINIDIKNKEGQIVKTVTLTAQNALPNNSNVWELQADNLEKYDKNGVLQTYTISEQINEKLQYFYREPKYDQEKLTVTNIATYVPDVKDEYPEYKIIVNKNIINNKNYPATKDDFSKIKLNSTDTYEFPIVLKSLNKEVVKNGKKLTEVYQGYSGNTFKGILTNKGDLVFNNIPAGKYEIVEIPSQYFDFVDFQKLEASTNAVFSEENGKYFITLPGLTAQNEDITIKATNKLDTERLYDEEKTKNNFFK